MQKNPVSVIVKNLLLMLLITASKLSAQSITSYTLNMGGGAAKAGYYQFEWSIGEGASVNTFSNNSTLMVTSGVLQPFTGLVAGNNVVSAAWAKDEIAVFPVPTHATLEIDLKLATTGKLSLQVFNASGNLLLTKLIDYDQTNSIQKLDLSALPAGMYFLNVLLNASNDNRVIRNGAFKIQKL